MLDKNHKKDFLNEYSDNLLITHNNNNLNKQDFKIPFKTKMSNVDGYLNSTPGSFKLFF
jgi:hypothetical protein